MHITTVKKSIGAYNSYQPTSGSKEQCNINGFPLCSTDVIDEGSLKGELDESALCQIGPRQIGPLKKSALGKSAP